MCVRSPGGFLAVLSHRSLSAGGVVGSTTGTIHACTPVVVATADRASGGTAWSQQRAGGVVPWFAHTPPRAPLSAAGQAFFTHTFPCRRRGLALSPPGCWVCAVRAFKSILFRTTHPGDSFGSARCLDPGKLAAMAPGHCAAPGSGGRAHLPRGPLARATACDDHSDNHRVGRRSSSQRPLFAAAPPGVGRPGGFGFGSTGVLATQSSGNRLTCNAEAQATRGEPPVGKMRSKLFLNADRKALHITERIGGCSVLRHDRDPDIHHGGCVCARFTGQSHGGQQLGSQLAVGPGAARGVDDGGCVCGRTASRRTSAPNRSSPSTRAG